MAVSNAEANWEGSLKEGKGGMKLGSGALSAPFSFGTRFEGATGTNPEELIGAALAGCFSMALSAGLGKNGFTPTKINTTAKVHLEKVGEGFKITRIELNNQSTIPNIDEAKFAEIAEATKKGCPVSQALTGTSIELATTLSK